MKQLIKRTLRRLGYDIVRFVPSEFQLHRPFDVMDLLVRERLSASTDLFLRPSRRQ